MAQMTRGISGFCEYEACSSCSGAGCACACHAGNLDWEPVIRRRVLLVASHPDDEILGAGGTLAKHVAAGDDVVVLILCGRSEEHRAAAQKAAEVVGHRLVCDVWDAASPGERRQVVLDQNDQRFDCLPLKHLAEDITRAALNAFQDGPEIVYIHSPKDLNQDHQRAAHATLIAFRPSSMPSVRELLAFEVPSSSEWGQQPFAPTLFVGLGPFERQRKTDAWARYAALEGQGPNLPRRQRSLDAHDVWRGATVGAEAAEAFEVLRMAR